MVEKTITVTINGEELIIPEQMTAEELLALAGDDPRRNLLRLGENGNQVVRKGEANTLADGAKYTSAPTFRYGESDRSKCAIEGNPA